MIDYIQKKQQDRIANPRKEIEITMEKGTFLPQEALEWFRFHFPQSSTFDGFFQICYRRGPYFRTLWTGLQDNVEEFLHKMKIVNGSDYYISANCTTTINRKKEHLFAMQNMVIDVDCHSEHLTRSQRKALTEAFCGTLKKENQFLPLPHSIVKTGRGVQLWWAIQPTHAKCLYFYNQVKTYFIHCVEHLLIQEKSTLEGLTVDHVASNNAVGIFRLPGTNNPKARAKVALERTEVKEPYLLQDLEKIAKENRRKLKSSDGKIHPKETAQKAKFFKESMADVEHFATNCGEGDLALLSGVNSFTYFRIKQLIQLFTLRDKPKGEEERNNFSLLVYSALRGSLSHEDSWQRLPWFNQKFKQPLTLPELANVISSACYKEGYRYSNQKVIEFLHITQEEKEEIGLFVKDDAYAIEPKQNAHKKHFNKVKKEHRNQQVKHLFEEDVTTEEIAKQLSISIPTVNRITKPLRTAKKAQLLQEIRAQLNKGITFANIVKNSEVLSKVPQGSVYSYRTQALALVL